MKINGGIYNVDLRNVSFVICFRVYLLRRRGRYTHVSFVLQESIPRKRFLRRLPLSLCVGALKFSFLYACHPRFTYSRV